ncbi:MAG: phosphotransferase [Eubacteriales bacterium]|nr:phosphotransferase [Eubacteriales bacterium]MDD3881072.1 phosphotransferase [Eubacteriales bacterium]MDD4511859.1 phosphotransferase [Eubacteriales bacterium]
MRDESEIKALLERSYNIKTDKITKSADGAGSDTFFLSASGCRYVLKFPEESPMNAPENEPELCEHLFRDGISVSRFVRGLDGKFIQHDESGAPFHLRHYIEGMQFKANTMPKAEMALAADALSRIHASLSSFPPLPEGIGSGFFVYMTPDRAPESYERAIKAASESGAADIKAELEWRIGLMKRMKKAEFDLSRLSVVNTHGDYTNNQLIFSGRRAIRRAC